MKFDPSTRHQTCRSADEALLTRQSIRAFLPREVPRETIDEILQVAARAPSGTNTQPWKVYVVAGEPRAELSRKILAAFDDPAVAEIAFIVADEYQGRGIGSFLMDALTIAARVGGVQRFTARLLAENTPMRSILERYGAEWEREEPGVVVTAFDVPAAGDLRVEPAMADEIRSMTRQVVRASVG